MDTEIIPNYMIEKMGWNTYLIISILLLIAVPILVFFRCYSLSIRTQNLRKLYLYFGLLMAIWATACFYTIPYIGVYPSLVALGILHCIPNMSYEIFLLITANIVTWLLIGYVLFKPIYKHNRGCS